jgi:vacuolar-type H+-ATPase subunit I/STV1
MSRTITYFGIIVGFLLSTHLLCFAQSKSEILKGLDSLNAEKETLIQQLDKINQSIASFEQKKLQAIKKEKYSAGVPIYCRNPTKLYQERKTWSTIIDTIPKSMTLLAYDYESNYYFVEFDTLYGFVFAMDIETVERRTERLEKEAVKRRNKQQERNRQVAQNSADREAQRKKQEARRQTLIAKYGNSIGDKLSRKEIWLGMAKELVRESRGEPSKVNRSIGSWGEHEQWVYPNANLYIRNGILSSWQD